MTNLTSLREVRALLNSRGWRPSKALGQNFLIDLNILDLLANAAALTGGEQVIEVGPGLGALTERLLAGAERVVAIEADGRLVEWLAQRFEAQPRLTLIHGDALRIDPRPYLSDAPVRLVSNLPYSVGTRILVDTIYRDPPPERMVVTVQDEVAQRLTAGAGSSAFGLLSVWAQLRYRIRKVHGVAPGCFWPRPGVQSAIVCFERRAEALLPSSAEPLLRAITRTAFGQRRKKAAGVLASAASQQSGAARDFWADALAAAGSDADARPQDIELQVWCALTRLVSLAPPALWSSHLTASATEFDDATERGKTGNRGKTTDRELGRAMKPLSNHD